jgi:8-oxo-dGTP pyrophosphatase MutT (NUDIX family)
MPRLPAPFPSRYRTRMPDRDADRHADAPHASGPWVRRSRTTVYRNRGMEVWHDEVRRPDGEPGIYGVVHFLGRAVGVVALDEAGRVLLVGQHRYTLDAFSWEIPEGGVGPDETLLDGARRELREETGYQAGEWRELLAIHLSNSITDEEGMLFAATGLQPGDAAPDGTEELEVRWVPLAEAVAMIDRREITDGLTVCAILRVALERSG